MPDVTTVVVGAGHAGLAMCHHLAARSIDHVVLERGEVAHSWRTQRWDSLRLLTPSWMTRLPGWSYDGPDPHGHLTAAETASLIRRYAAAQQAPVLTGAAVTAVRPGRLGGLGMEIETEHERWQARTVVLAAGTTRPAVPTLAARVPPEVECLSALGYRNPDQLPEGGVLVVGGSASGAQVAEELQRSGRPVTLAVGEHVRMPRNYRGQDVFCWLDRAGILDQRWDEVDDLTRARALPSPQLVAGRTLDLNGLQDAGVRVVGKVAGLRDGVALLSGGLANVCALADLKLGRLLDTFDELSGGRGERPDPTVVRRPPLELDLTSGEIRSLVWATGVRPDLSFLDLPVLDRHGRLRHDAGVTPWPGLYVMGLPLLRRRRSSYIDGARADAADLADHLAAHLAGRSSLRPALTQEAS